MLLPDDLIINKNCTKEMIKLHKLKNASVIATKKVNKSLSNYNNVKKEIINLNFIKLIIYLKNYNLRSQFKTLRIKRRFV